MTYTATALSFMFENLDKPVLITGSQLPIVEPRNDAVKNLTSSIMLAAPSAFDLPRIPEVCIFFDDVLLRGNRSRKVSSSGFSGFASPNYPVLAEAGEHIRVNESVVRSRPANEFFVNKTMDSSVVLVDVFPGIRPGILRSIFDIQG